MKFRIVALIGYFLIAGCQAEEGHTNLKSKDTVQFETTDGVIKYLREQGVDVRPTIKNTDSTGEKELVEAFNLRYSDYTKLIKLIMKNTKSLVMSFSNINIVIADELRTRINVDINSYAPPGQKRKFHEVFYRILAYSVHLSASKAKNIMFSVDIDNLFELMPKENFWKKLLPNLSKIQKRANDLEKQFEKELQLQSNIKMSVYIDFIKDDEDERIVYIDGGLDNDPGDKNTIIFTIDVLKKGMPGLDKFLNTKFDFEKIKKGIVDPETQPFMVQHLPRPPAD